MIMCTSLGSGSDINVSNKSICKIYYTLHFSFSLPSLVFVGLYF
jgi:hypothetical protein